MDLRERVVAACDAGDQTVEVIAVRFKVSVRWIYKLLLRRKQEATIAPRIWRRGRKAAFSGELLEQLEACLQERPDRTLEEIRELFSDRVSCSLQAVANAIQRLGWRYKKSHYEPANRIEPTSGKLAASGVRNRSRSTAVGSSSSTNRRQKRI
jgi:transposase